MRKFRLFILTALVSVALFSCNSIKKSNDTPEEATAKFVKAFYTADFNEMYKYTAKNNRPIIKQIEQSMEGNREKLDAMRKNEIEIKEVQCTMQNDTMAECECNFLFNNNGRKMTYNLCEEEGKWVVDLTISY